MTGVCQAVQSALHFRDCARSIGGCGSCYGALLDDIRAGCADPEQTIRAVNRILRYDPARHASTWNAWCNKVSLEQAGRIVTIVQRAAGRRRPRRQTGIAAAVLLVIALTGAPSAASDGAETRPTQVTLPALLEQVDNIMARPPRYFRLGAPRVTPTNPHQWSWEFVTRFRPPPWAQAHRPPPWYSPCSRIPQRQQRVSVSRPAAPAGCNR